MLAEPDLDRLVAACRRLPATQADFLHVDDLVTNLLLTVLDLQLQTATVERALAHYRAKRWDAVRSMQDLQALLDRFPDDQAGNTALAEHLWGYRLWTRAGLLRGLVQYFAARGVRSQADLAAWAASSEYERDFAGQVKGLGLAAYSSLVMRQGVETIKPDVHVLRFVATVLGRPLAPAEAVTALQEVARVLGLKAYELDWRIWEHQRGLRV